MQEVILFYNGLEVLTRQILDPKGAIPTETSANVKIAIQYMAKYSQKWHNRTSKTISIETYDGLAAIQAQPNNLGREIKKFNEKVYAAQEKDQGSFTLPCYINHMCFEKALADLGASVSVMSLSTYLNLGLSELAHTKFTIELADRAVKHPKEITKNILVGNGFEHVSANFLPNLSIKVMSRKFYNSIGKDKIDYKGKNVVKTFIHVPIFVGNFYVVTNFAVMKNMDIYRDKDMRDVIIGEPFFKVLCVEARRFYGLITIHNGDNNVTYQIVRSHPRIPQKYECAGDVVDFRTRLGISIRDHNNEYYGFSGVTCLNWIDYSLIRVINQRCKVLYKVVDITTYLCKSMYSMDEWELTVTRPTKEKHKEAAASYADLIVAIEGFTIEADKNRNNYDVNNVMSIVEQINEARVTKKSTLFKALNKVSKTLEADSVLKASIQKMAETNTTTSRNIIEFIKLIKNAKLLEIITQLNEFQTSLNTLSSQSPEVANKEEHVQEPQVFEPIPITIVRPLTKPAPELEIIETSSRLQLTDTIVEVKIPQPESPQSIPNPNRGKFCDFRITKWDELREIIPKKKNKVVEDLMNSLSTKHERLRATPEELGIRSSLPVPGQVLSLPKGVPFVNNLVTKHPKNGLFFIDVFGDEALQKMNEIYKVDVDTLLTYLVMASNGSTPANQRFFLALRSLIDSHPDKEKLK
nr:hypothetical protein [Tanacetum cinerariifolium]